MIACDSDKYFGQVDTAQKELEGITTAYRQWCWCYFNGLGIERRS
jgi:hypothetical protein